MDASITFAISKEDKELLLKRAKQEGRSVSNFLRRMVETALRKEQSQGSK